MISVRPPGIHASLWINLSITQKEADHAESDWNSRDHISAESGLCYRQDTVIRFLLPPAAETVLLFTHCERSEINQNVSGVWLIPQLGHRFLTFHWGLLGMNVVWSCRIVRRPWKKPNGWNKTYCKQGMLFTSSVSNSLYRQCYHLFGHVPSVILYLNFLLSDIVNAELASHNASMWGCLSSWMEIYALVQGWPRKSSNEVYFCAAHVGFSARWISNSNACCLDARRYRW